MISEELQEKFKYLTNSSNSASILVKVLSAKKSEREKFYYLFYRRNDESSKVDVKPLVIKLGKVILESAYE